MSTENLDLAGRLTSEGWEECRWQEVALSPASHAEVIRQLARALRESAEREAETRRAISVIVTNATGWRGLGGDAVELARRLASELATAEAEGFRRGVEAAEKACAIPHYMAAICAAAIRALVPHLSTDEKRGEKPK